MMWNSSSTSDQDCFSASSMLLMGSSPTSATLFEPSPIAAVTAASSNRVSESLSSSKLSFEDFLEILPEVIRRRKELAVEPGSANDPVQALMENVHLDRSDWAPYAYFDADKNYTRNLIATDHETYTLLLLCWNQGRESPIHDHPCDGCWMRCLQGHVREVRYVKPDPIRSAPTDRCNRSLVCTQDTTVSAPAVVFIQDSQGYHKVGNPSMTEPAVTLHLYSPPFQKCKIWLDQHDCSRPSTSHVCYYSEYGERR